MTADDMYIAADWLRKSADKREAQELARAIAKEAGVSLKAVRSALRQKQAG